jgi:hypothetical protein
VGFVDIGILIPKIEIEYYLNPPAGKSVGTIS